MSWYEEQVRQGLTFDMQQELEKYCTGDVDILLQAVMTFRDLFLQMTSVDPFTRAITTPAACMEAYRLHFLPREYQLALIPGRRPLVKQSIRAQEWLSFMRVSKYSDLLSSRNYLNGEVRIANLHVDGYSPSTKTILEFLGCYWHGCPSCHPDREKVVRHGPIMTAEQVHQEWMRRFEALKRLGFNVNYIWECTFVEMQKQDEELRRRCLKVRKLITRFGQLQPGDALFGGRTDAMRQWAESNGKNSKIGYLDVNSLYPYVLKNSRFPIGKPRIILGEDLDTEEFVNNIEQYEGVVKCLILPPQQLLLPILPYKCDKGTTFCLCHTCAEMPLTEEDDSYCYHVKQEERALLGTWDVREVEMALQKGYQLLELGEILQFDKTAKRIQKQES